MKNKQFIERRPNFVEGFEDKIYEVNNIEEVLEIEWVKSFQKWRNRVFYLFALSIEPENKFGLIVLYDWDEENKVSKNRAHIGYITGFTLSETGMKNFKDLI